MSLIEWVFYVIGVLVCFFVGLAIIAGIFHLFYKNWRWKRNVDKDISFLMMRAGVLDEQEEE